MQKLAPNMKLVSTFKYLHRLHHNQTENTETTCHMVMAIRAVEFSNGGINLESLLPKIEHTQRKFVNFEDFEDWTTLQTFCL